MAAPIQGPKVFGHIPKEELERLKQLDIEFNKNKEKLKNSPNLLGLRDFNKSRRVTKPLVIDLPKERQKVDALGRLLLSQISNNFTGLVIVNFYRGSISKTVSRYRHDETTLELIGAKGNIGVAIEDIVVNTEKKKLTEEN